MSPALSSWQVLPSTCFFQMGVPSARQKGTSRGLLMAEVVSTFVSATNASFGSLYLWRPSSIGYECHNVDLRPPLRLSLRIQGLLLLR